MKANTPYMKANATCMKVDMTYMTVDMTYFGLDLLQITPIWEPLLIGFLKMELKYSVNGRT